MAANLTDIVTFGENKSRGPLYNRSLTVIHTGYTKILNVNPARKFLLIKPLANHIHVHFLQPGLTDTAASFYITDSNSFTLNSGHSVEALTFSVFVPTNSLWIKANTTSTEVVIYEA
jgi:hypothetical protein